MIASVQCVLQNEKSLFEEQEDLSQTGLRGMPCVVALPILTWQCLLTKAVLPFISWGHRQASFLHSFPCLEHQEKQGKAFICFFFIYDGPDGTLLPSPGAHKQWGQFSWRDGSCHVGYRKESRLVNRLLWPNDEFL